MYVVLIIFKINFSTFFFYRCTEKYTIFIFLKGSKPGRVFTGKNMYC